MGGAGGSADMLHWEFFWILTSLSNNSTASSNDVNDGQADERMSQQKFQKPQTAIKRWRNNDKNKVNQVNRDRRRQEPNLEPKHSLICKQNMPVFMNKEGKCSAEPA